MYDSWVAAEVLAQRLPFLESVLTFQLQTAYKEYQNFQDSYCKLERSTRRVKDLTFMQTWEDLQTKAQELQERVIRERQGDSPVSPSPSRTTDSSVSMPPRWRRLKELPLPIYDGNLANRRSFWRLFTDVLEDDYTDDEKLCYLMECLKDPVVKKIVQESIANGDDYNRVEARLKREMDQPREVYLQALRSITSMNQIDYDKAGLTTLSTDFLRHVNTLKSYGDGTMGQLLTAVAELKMTSKLRQE